jgi:hypothetical protein
MYDFICNTRYFPRAELALTAGGATGRRIAGTGRHRRAGDR